MIIERHIKPNIVEHLQKKEITIITGARQTGKTTLLLDIKKDLENSGQKVLLLNLDIDSHRQYFRSQEALLQKTRLELGTNGYVFIDEIQRLENAGLFIKGIYDRNTPYKFVLTGSGSIELKEKIQESLAGRKRLFELTPVTFPEFVDYKTDYKYRESLSLFFEVETEKTNSLLDEYLNYGGYPRIILESTAEEKQKLMDEIFKSYVEKDLVYLLRIDRPETFTTLIKILAAQSGGMINYSQLATQTGISVPTLKKYLWYAEKTFCIHYVSPFFTNPLKEITKSPIYYFNDLGLRNYSIAMMGKLTIYQQFGFVFQNLVYNILSASLRWSNNKIHFWRTTDKAEVDFVIQGSGNQPIPVEVKYGQIRPASISRSFRSFIEKYNPANAFVIYRGIEAEIMINNTTVTFLPWYKLFEYFNT
ncbi:MAG: ATP-binding protein [Cyclobacteriaceae bacterium]|nr:ATP-binding protein [Cyclobacteriaceae bacterium]